MKPLPLGSLRIQAILWTLLPLTAIVLLVGSVGVYAYGEIVSRLVQDRDKELAAVNADRLGENLVDLALVLEAFNADGQMASENFAEKKGRLLTGIQSGLLQSFDGGVTLLDVDGQVELSLLGVESDVGVYREQYRNFGSAGYATLPFVEALLTGGSGSPPRYSDVIEIPGDPWLDEPQILLGVPLYDGDGELHGALIGSFLLRNQTLGREVSKLGIGIGYLVDREGRVIWHRDPEQIGKDFSVRGPVRALLRGQSGAAAQQDVDARGGQVVVGYDVVDESGWGLVIQESWEEVIGPIRTFQWLMLGTLGVGLILVMVIISSGTRRITGPIRELVAQTEQLASGDFVGHVEGGSIVEIRSLADAFNEMAGRVARYRAGLQSYVSAVTYSQEEERRRIARELHDDTIQSLVALGRRLELLEQSLENPIEGAKQLYHLQQMVSQTIGEVRQFSRDLRPLMLEDLGLEAALRQMLRELERRDGLDSTLTIEGELAEPLDDEMEVCIYRVAQEALSNVRRHADASRVELRLRRSEHEIELEVRDDGRGFPVEQTEALASRGSFGLMGIRERVRLFGGTVEVDSAPGRGTTLRIALPLHRTDSWLLEELQRLPAEVTA